MQYKILDHRIIKAFRKYLEEKNIKFEIEWKPCCVAIFHINAEPEQVYDVQYGYYDIQWKLFFC